MLTRRTADVGHACGRVHAARDQPHGRAAAPRSGVSPRTHGPDAASADSGGRSRSHLSDPTPASRCCGDQERRPLLGARRGAAGERRSGPSRSSAHVWLCARAARCDASLSMAGRAARLRRLAHRRRLPPRAGRHTCAAPRRALPRRSPQHGCSLAARLARRFHIVGPLGSFDYTLARPCPFSEFTRRGVSNELATRRRCAELGASSRRLCGRGTAAVVTRPAISNLARRAAVVLLPRVELAPANTSVQVSIPIRPGAF